MRNSSRGGSAFLNSAYYLPYSLTKRSPSKRPLCGRSILVRSAKRTPTEVNRRRRDLTFLCRKNGRVCNGCAQIPDNWQVSDGLDFMKIQAQVRAQMR